MQWVKSIRCQSDCLESWVLTLFSLLRARPVMSVSAQLSFSPKEISLNYFECPGSNAFNAFNLTSCFTVTERTSSTGNISEVSESLSVTWRICLTSSCLSGSLEKKLNVSLNLNVDVVRGMSRGFFDQSSVSSRTLQQSVLLDSGSSCFNFSIFMLVRVVYHKFSQSQQLRSDGERCVCFSAVLQTQYLLWRYEWISHKLRCCLETLWLFLTSTAGRRRMLRWVYKYQILFCYSV